VRIALDDYVLPFLILALTLHCDVLVAPLSKYKLSNVKTEGGLTTYSSGSDPVSRGADFCRRVMPFRSVLELCRWIREKSGCF
jgi:hypothetical protein